MSTSATCSTFSSAAASSRSRSGRQTVACLLCLCWARVVRSISLTSALHTGGRSLQRPPCRHPGRPTDSDSFSGRSLDHSGALVLLNRCAIGNARLGEPAIGNAGDARTRHGIGVCSGENGPWARPLFSIYRAGKAGPVGGHAGSSRSDLGAASGLPWQGFSGHRGADLAMELSVAAAVVGAWRRAASATAWQVLHRSELGGPQHRGEGLNGRGTRFVPSGFAGDVERGRSVCGCRARGLTAA